MIPYVPNTYLSYNGRKPDPIVGNILSVNPTIPGSSSTCGAYDILHSVSSNHLLEPSQKEAMWQSQFGRAEVASGHASVSSAALEKLYLGPWTHVRRREKVDGPPNDTLSLKFYPPLEKNCHKKCDQAPQTQGQWPEIRSLLAEFWRTFYKAVFTSHLQ